MTGHGAATAQDDLVQVLIEIRSVNNRFLKISVSGDLDASLQSKVEAIVRERTQRGAVNVRAQIQFLGENSQFQINIPQLKAYQAQLESANFPNMELNSVLALPGIVNESMEESKLESCWPVIEKATQQALDKFIDMRATEGKAMLDDLMENCSSLKSRVEQVKEIAPNVVDEYSNRITERINRMLEQHEVSVTTPELIREVGIFADRVDTSEELVRLDSHIDQFREIANGETSNGRKLDFLTQELLRETNTIGSKANDATIANHVVEMKTTIERIREMIQNIE